MLTLGPTSRDTATCDGFLIRLHVAIGSIPGNALMTE